MSPQSFNKAMGRYVETLRKSHGLTFAEMGSTLGVSWQQVQKYTKGKNAFAAHQLPLLAEMLGVTVEQLYKAAGVKGTDSAPTEAQNDGFLAARYVSRIADGKLRGIVIDMARKCAYQRASA